MLITFDHVLDRDQVLKLRAALEAADWEAGTATAAGAARRVKSNQQLPIEHPLTRELGRRVLEALSCHPGFVSAALPQRIVPPRFNRYAEGARYGTHVDAAVMRDELDGSRLRTDLSATLFLSEPEDYDGGELLIETGFGAQAVKLPAGSLVLYPASSLHQVTAVSRGERLAAFFWVQSLVSDAAARALLFDLDRSIQQLTPEFEPADSRLLALSGIYHNLVRRWAQP